MVVSVFVIETLAIGKTFRIAIKLGISKVIIESDSQVAIDSVFGRIRHQKDKKLNRILSDILQMILEKLNLSAITEKNRLTNWLAKRTHFRNFK